MFYGRGAGDLPTASALVSDLVKASGAKRHALPAVGDEPCMFASDWECVHFVRLLVRDEPGVLAQVAGKFARYGVSIASMVQKGERDDHGFVQAIFLTHKASEYAVRSALGDLQGELASVGSVIRVEGT